MKSTRRYLAAAAFALLSSASLQATARFLSVDPVQANPQNGANFNRYTYGNNNPYRFIDPDGRWACSASASPGDCGRFEAGWNLVRESRNSPTLSDDERMHIDRSLEFYGDKGDPRVTISFGYLNEAEGHATDKQATFDLNKANRGSFRGRSAEQNTLLALGKTITHEGSHGYDYLKGIAEAITRLNLEIRGYTAQAAFQKAAMFDDDGAGKNGWSSFGGMNHNFIRNQAELSTTAQCVTLSGCDGK